MSHPTGQWIPYAPGTFVFWNCAKCGAKDTGGGRRGWIFRWLTPEEKSPDPKTGAGCVDGLYFAGSPMTLALCGKDAARLSATGKKEGDL